MESQRNVAYNKN